MKKIIIKQKRLNSYLNFLFDTKTYSFEQIYKTLHKNATRDSTRSRWINNLSLRKKYYERFKHDQEILIPMTIKKYKTGARYSSLISQGFDDSYYLISYIPKFEIFSCILLCIENSKTKERQYSGWWKANEDL